MPGDQWTKEFYDAMRDKELRGTYRWLDYLSWRDRQELELTAIYDRQPEMLEPWSLLAVDAVKQHGSLILYCHIVGPTRAKISAQRYTEANARQLCEAATTLLNDALDQLDASGGRARVASRERQRRLAAAEEVVWGLLNF
jgi:hypothetical protein